MRIRPSTDENDTNTDYRSGELVALMGPSGCGKTTLLNVLAHRTAASRAKESGETYVNGHDIDMASFGRITTYVEQEDALIGSLTVQETLKFAGDLSLPRYRSPGETWCNQHRDF